MYLVFDLFLFPIHSSCGSGAPIERHRLNTATPSGSPGWHSSSFVSICIRHWPVFLLCRCPFEVTLPIARVIRFSICANVCKRESFWVEGMAGLFLAVRACFGYKFLHECVFKDMSFHSPPWLGDHEKLNLWWVVFMFKLLTVKTACK